MTVKER